MPRRALGRISQDRADPRGRGGKPPRFGTRGKVFEIDAVKVEPVELRFHGHAVDLQLVVRGEQGFQPGARGGLFGDFENILVASRDRLARFPGSATA